MAKWYPAHNYTPADNYSLQAVPNPGAYTDLVTGDMALVYTSGQLNVHVYDSTSAAVESIPEVVTPDGNGGNGRWLKKVFGSDRLEYYTDPTAISHGNGLEVRASNSDSPTLYLSSQAGVLQSKLYGYDVQTAIQLYNGAAWEDALVCNLNGNVELYHNGILSLRTEPAGIMVRDTDGDDCGVVFESSVGTNLAQFYTADSSYLGADMWNGSGWEAAFRGYLNGAIKFYYDNIIEGETISGGFKATNSLTIAATTNVTGILDEDDMSSDSAVSLATQQSIKSYVDNNAGPATHTPVPYTTSGAIDVGDTFVELDSTAGDIAMTYAAPAPGRTVYFSCTNADNAITVTLGSGGFFFTDSGITDTGTVATFTTVGQCLCVFGQSSTRYIVTSNIDNVGIE